MSSTSLRTIFSRQTREKPASSIQDPTESWSLKRFRREYESLSLEMERVREMARYERQVAYNAEHDTISSRSMLLAVRKAFKDLEKDLANGIDIDHCRRVVNDSDVPSHATTELHNELKRLRATVHAFKSRVKDLAAEVKEHFK